MKLEIKKERDTPLLSRKRVTLNAEYEGSTPSRMDIRKETAKKLKAKENLVVIKHIYTRFGAQKAKIIAHVYEDEKDMKKLEGEGLLKKHNAGEEKKEGGSDEGSKSGEEPEKEEEKKEEPAGEEAKEDTPENKEEQAGKE
ncbi:MAG: 30S ribosomal protein S24e [Candidatus Woesearchaeota archaeon]